MTNTSRMIDEIECKQKRLKRASSELKQHFVGIDSIIDRVISGIEAWYCMPELLTRPTIICLWGLTGNGKTDLVRRLVSELGMSESFLEIQMTNKGSSQHAYHHTLQSVMASSNVVPEDRGILLLDEMQRFRSINKDGTEIMDYQFQDLWMLLSDGSFGNESSNRQRVVDLLLENLYEKDFEKSRKEEKGSKERKFSLDAWSARRMQKLLSLDEPLERIMSWDIDKRINVIEEKLQDRSIFKPKIYNKLLIFISGNLDEAYSMADNVDEADVDADIFHKHSLRIDLIKIKEALAKRFKPEQIARFGNTHVIYPALNRNSYEKIIQKRTDDILKKVEETSNVKFVVDSTVYDAIYRNGVFPAQGTRPLFSTISSFFESIIPTFTLKSLQKSQKRAILFYEDYHLCADIGGEVIRIKNEGDIDRIKRKKSDKNALIKVAVHEAGHSLAYTLLFGVMPTQVAVLLASNSRSGFVGLHAIKHTKKSILDLIQVILAGRVAEEIVFGHQNASIGATHDLDQATGYASNYMRTYGFGNVISRRCPITEASLAQIYNTNIEFTNELIETILQEQKENVTKLLLKHKDILKSMSSYLVEHTKIGKDDYIAMFESFNLPCKYIDAEEQIDTSIEDKFNEFLADKTT